MTNQSTTSNALDATPRRIAVWPMALVAVVAFSAYGPQLSYPFVYDDTAIVLDNPVVQDGPWYRSLTEPYWPAHVSRDPLYRPVTTLSLRLQYAVVGDAPFAFRLVNALIHALCAALVARIGMRLAPQRSAAIAGLAAGLLFAVHPLNAEAVCLVVGRAELLAACFGLALIAMHIAGHPTARARSAGYHVASAVLYLLAVGSKEHGVFLLPAILLIDMARRPKHVGARGMIVWLRDAMTTHGLGMVLAATAFFLVRWSIFGQHATLRPGQVDPFANPLIGASTISQFTTPFALLFLAVRLFVVPIGLCPIWSIGGLDMPETLLRLDVLVGVVLAAAFIGVGVWSIATRQLRWLTPGLAGLFLLIPCHFLPAANWLFAERWLYLPTALLVLFVVPVVRSGKVWFMLLPVTMALFGSAWSYQQSWRDSQAMMREVLDRRPAAYHALIGHLHFAVEENRLVDAQDEVLRLMERFPDAPQSWFYYALLQHQHGQHDQVLHAIRQWVRLTSPTPLPPSLRRAQRSALRALERPPSQIHRAGEVPGA